MGRYIQDKKTGRMLGAEAGPGKDRTPTAAPELAARQVEDATAAVPYTQQYEKTVGSTGKAGTDAPPLVAEIRKGRATHRFYACDPQTKVDLESGHLDLNEALNTGKAFPSITTCIGALDKPALPMWAAGVAADYGHDVLTELQGMNEEERDERLAELLAIADRRTGRSKFRKEAGVAHRQQGDAAAGRGTEVHALAEAISRGENPEVPEELAGYVAGVRKFHEAFPDAEFIYTEATVYNETARTMGTTDAIVRIGDKLYVVDYKTNKNATVYGTTGMQLAAAANAKEIVHADGRRESMPEIHGGIGVGIGPNGEMNLFHFETERHGPNFKGFLGARRAWQWKYDTGPDPKPVSPDFFRN